MLAKRMPSPYILPRQTYKQKGRDALEFSRLNHIRQTYLNNVWIKADSFKQTFMYTKHPLSKALKTHRPLTTSHESLPTTPNSMQYFRELFRSMQYTLFPFSDAVVV